MVYVDNKNTTNNVNKIKKNTNIDNIEYINYYDNYYIVKNKEYLYLFDSKYSEIFKIDNVLLYENKNNYDIIYKDGILMYMNSEYKDNKLIFTYYDLYTYEEIDKVVLGG